MPNPAQSIRLGADQIARLIQEWPAALDLKQVSRHFDVRVFDHEQGDHVDHPDIASVVIHQGGVYIDGKPVANPLFSRNFVRFAHKTRSTYTSGVLNFTLDGHAFTGKLFLGASETTAQAYDVAGVAPPTVYTTRIANTGAVPTGKQQFPSWSPPEPDDQSQWIDGLNLVIGYQFTQSGQLPEPIYELADPTGAQSPADISSNATPSIDPQNQNLILTLAFDDPTLPGLAVDQYGPEFPGAFGVEFAWDGMSFRGEMQRFDTSTGQTDPTQYAWHGTAQPIAAPRVSPAMVAAAAALFAAAAEPQGLTLAELFTLQADAQTLQNDQFNMLTQNMKWALAHNKHTKDWLSTFFGEEPPVGFSSERETLITRELPFYTDRFAVCYLGTAFNNMTGSGAPSTKLNTGQTLDLDFYMRAGLATEKGYNTQSQGVFLQSFVEAVPRLQPYIQDQNAHPNDPAHDWATLLYNQITSAYLMNLAVSKVIAGQGMEEANRHSTVLLVLQPSGELASQYHKLIVNTSLSRAVEHLNLNDKAAVQSWLGDSIQGFIDALLQGKLVTDGMDPTTQARLEEQARELQEAVEDAGNLTQLAAALTDLTVAAGGKDFWEKMANAQSAWGKAGYRFASAIYALALVGGLTNAILSFQNWDNLKPTDKAVAIVSVVQVVAQVIKSMPEILTSTPVKWGFNQVGKLYQKFAVREVVEDVGESMELLSPTAYEDGGRYMGSLANSETRVMEVEGTTWVKTFNSTIGKFCEVLGVVAAVAFAVISTVEFVLDIVDEKPIETTVLDGIILAANVGVAVFAVAALFTAATFVPVLGAVFAIIGLIATLIELFDPPAQPPSPVEVFMTDTLVPAVRGSKRWILDSPSGWTTDATVPLYNAYNPEPKALTA